MIINSTIWFINEKLLCYNFTLVQPNKMHKSMRYRKCLPLKITRKSRRKKKRTAHIRLNVNALSFKCHSEKLIHSVIANIHCSVGHREVNAKQVFKREMSFIFRSFLSMQFMWLLLFFFLFRCAVDSDRRIL